MNAPPLTLAPDSMRWPWLFAGDTPPEVGSPPEASFPRSAARAVNAEPASVRLARDFVRSAVELWGMADRCDDIALVVSELVTNAVNHVLPQAGGWPIHVGIWQASRDAALLCAVTDSSPAPPVLRDVVHAVSGHGLQIVNSLSDSWGFDASSSGKVVWTTFASGS